MIKFPFNFKGLLGYKHNKITNVLDQTVFPICNTKEKEIGFLRKRVWYIHRFQDRWEIVQIHPQYVYKVYSIKND